MKKILIGLAWPYVNGDLHIGHLAGYLFPADIFARFHRFLGNDVLMVSGSDCYGTPITIEADRRGLHPKDIIDEYHAKNVSLFKELGISFDLYTKTTTETHKNITQEIFLALLNKGYVIKKTTPQYYSPAEKKFLPDRYVEGICPHCDYEGTRSDQCENCGRVLEQGELINPKSKENGKKVELRDTEHYFIDWQKFEPFLKSYLEKRKGRWREWVWNEAFGWLKEGLKPRAITRDLDWGIELPLKDISEDKRIRHIEEKRIYVWFEAVIGYLSASIEWSHNQTKKGKKVSWEDFWCNERAERSYFMGKDNLAFHALFWPGELYGYDEHIHLPDNLFINQFLTLEGQKFSKSRNIIIDSKYITETYGNDPVRFYLTSISPEKRDANFSWAEFVNKHNDVLIGNLGNFINRTLTLARDATFQEKLVEKKIQNHVEKKLEEAKEAMLHGEGKKYLETLLALSDEGNKYLSKHEPWKQKDSATHIFHKTMTNCAMILLGVQTLLKPLLPETCQKMEKMTGITLSLWPQKGELKRALQKINIEESRPLFRKIEKEVIEFERGKLLVQ